MTQDDQPNSNLAEAHDLIMQLLEGQLAPEDARRLEELVCNDAQVRVLYVKYVHQRALLASVGEPLQAELDDSRSLDDTMVMRAIRDADTYTSSEEELAPPPPITGLTLAQVHAGKQEQARRRKLRLRSGLAAAVVLALSTVALIVARRPAREPLVRAPQAPIQTAKAPATSQQPSPAYVATLSRQIQAKWGNPAEPLAEGHGFEANAKLSLAEGYAEFTLDTGAVVVVEAPADFTIRRNGVFLGQGKLAATVPPAAHGFVVVTPHATIIDLGTQLGVKTTPAGTTSVDVFQGKVTAQPAASAEPPVELTMGKAAAISANAVQMDPSGANPQHFVRQLTTTTNSLDLCDLLAGGDGTTAVRGGEIDVQTGAFGRFQSRQNVSGDGKYHRAQLPILDGCFIPNGLMPITSDGRQFDFGPTANVTFDYIRAGGPVAFTQASRSPTVPFTPVLGGVDYGSEGHGFILMHASSGLTFDLAAIRRLHPDKQLTEFRAFAGNTATDVRTVDRTLAKTTMMVLIDGQMRFERRDFAGKDGPATISIPLQEKDRFLTLTTLDRSKSIQFDWDIFADPRLTLSDHPLR